MIRTITLSDRISVQGVFDHDNGDGRITVRVGSQCFAGVPVTRYAAAAAQTGKGTAEAMPSGLIEA